MLRYQWTALVVLSVGVACGCGGTAAAPTGPTAVVIPAVSGAPAVAVAGRVVDAEQGVALPGSVVTAVQVCAPGACRALTDAPSVRATADSQGRFALAVNLPESWGLLLLRIARDGYETTNTYVAPSESAAAELRILRQLTIRAGESIAMHVFIGSYVCTWESHLCRRVVVDSPSGESMDLELTTANGERVLGLVVGPETNHQLPPRGLEQRVTVSGGEVWIYPQDVRPTPVVGVIGVFEKALTLTARRH